MARSRQKKDFVYDFLYIDAKRIGLLLSQFGPDGVLTELVRATDATSETGGKIDLKIVGMNQREGEKTGLVRKFDPQWLIPLIFLREAKDIIVRDVSKARIGQFVSMSGSLSISDLSILRLLWDVPFVQNSMSQGMTNNSSLLPELAQLARREPTRSERKASRTQNLTPTNPSLEQIRGLLEIVKVMPHGILATLQENINQKIWCALRDEWLIVSSADLMLNHGIVISGKWNIVGILDALPDTEKTTAIEPDPSIPFLGILNAFGPLARQFLGRPAESFGVTPLLIFREITA